MSNYFKIQTSNKIYLLSLLILIIFSLYITSNISKDYFILSETDNNLRNFMGSIVLAIYYLIRLIPIYFLFFFIWEIRVSSIHKIEISNLSLTIYRKYFIFRKKISIPFSDILSVAVIKRQDTGRGRFISGEIRIILKDNHKFEILKTGRNREQYFKEAIEFFRNDPNLSALVNLEVETVNTWKRVY